MFLAIVAIEIVGAATLYQLYSTIRYRRETTVDGYRLQFTPLSSLNHLLAEREYAEEAVTQARVRLAEQKAKHLASLDTLRGSTVRLIGANSNSGDCRNPKYVPETTGAVTNRTYRSLELSNGTQPRAFGIAATTQIYVATELLPEPVWVLCPGLSQLIADLDGAVRQLSHAEEALRQANRQVNSALMRIRGKAVLVTNSNCALSSGARTFRRTKHMAGQVISADDGRVVISRFSDKQNYLVMLQSHSRISHIVSAVRQQALVPA